MSDGVRPEVVAGDVQRGPGVAGEVACLCPVGGRGDSDDSGVGIGHLKDVGQLRCPVAVDGREDALLARCDERPELVLVAGHQPRPPGARSTGRPRPMPSIQTSLLTPVPAPVGQLLRFCELVLVFWLVLSVQYNCSSEAVFALIRANL